MDRIHVETIYSPVVLVTMQGLVPDDEYQRYLQQMSDALARKRDRIAIVDGRDSLMNSPKHGRMQAHWLREQRTALQELDFATVLVIDKPMVRFSLSAMLAFAPIPGTYKVTATVGEAAVWAVARLRSQRLAVPHALSRLAGGDDAVGPRSGAA